MLPHPTNGEVVQFISVYIYPFHQVSDCLFFVESSSTDMPCPKALTLTSAPRGPVHGVVAPGIRKYRKALISTSC
jgi:hypothetical protein